MNQTFTKTTTKVLFGIFFYLLIPWQAFAQSTTTGTVLDESKKPVPGVTVMEKGTKNGTTTNSEGKFSIRLTKPNAIVEVKMLGYVTKELPAEGKGVLNFNIQAMDFILRSNDLKNKSVEEYKNSYRLDNLI